MFGLTKIRKILESVVGHTWNLGFHNAQVGAWAWLCTQNSNNQVAQSLHKTQFPCDQSCPHSHLQIWYKLRNYQNDSTSCTFWLLDITYSIINNNIDSTYLCNTSKLVKEWTARQTVTTEIPMFSDLVDEVGLRRKDLLTYLSHWQGYRGQEFHCNDMIRFLVMWIKLMVVWATFGKG